MTIELVVAAVRWLSLSLENRIAALLETDDPRC
jgi:hypothetical protein